MRTLTAFGFSLALACGAALSGCSGEDLSRRSSEERVGEHFAQCEHRPGGGVDRSQAVLRTIDTHLPEDDINCTDTISFFVMDRQVSLVYVAFGTVSDCAAGCFSHDLCAIYDAPESLLYSTSMQPQPDRPGLAHPLTQTPAFQSFRASETDAGDWRFCFRDD